VITQLKIWVLFAGAHFDSEKGGFFFKSNSLLNCYMLRRRYIIKYLVLVTARTKPFFEMEVASFLGVMNNDIMMVIHSLEAIMEFELLCEYWKSDPL